LTTLRKDSLLSSYELCDDFELELLESEKLPELSDMLLIIQPVEASTNSSKAKTERVLVTFDCIPLCRLLNVKLILAPSMLWHDPKSKDTTKTVAMTSYFFQKFTDSISCRHGSV
jgi:hypothetical protein